MVKSYQLYVLHTINTEIRAMPIANHGEFKGWGLLYAYLVTQR